MLPAVDGSINSLSFMFGFHSDQTDELMASLTGAETKEECFSLKINANHKSLVESRPNAFRPLHCH